MASSQLYEGSCHCQAIGFRYRTALAPKEWSIRACQCTFCRSHAGLSTSDSAGSLEFIEHVPGALHRYQFGHKTADFLICKQCGTYIGATMQRGDKRLGIINVRVLHSLADQFAQAVPVNFAGEATDERLTRRESRWTPLTHA